MPNVRVVNYYGPTEATIDVTVHIYDEPNDKEANYSVPIGKPIENTKVFVLDSSYNVAPPGIVGELFLSGEQLARGYLGKPALTAEKFVPNPYSTGTDSYSRMYATGDLTRYRKDGTIDYIGRRDGQVKLRGFRIELGEIEEAVRQRKEWVSDCKVLVITVGGSKRIVAYSVLSPELLKHIKQEELMNMAKNLRDWCKKKLAHFMVPAYFIFLKSFPLFPNGKLNVKELPHPLSPTDSAKPTTRTIISPQNAIEAKLLSIWIEALGRNDISTTDNFFEIGGDSIVSIRIVSKAVQAGLPMKVKDMFDRPTIRGIASLLGEEGRRIIRGVKPQQDLVVGPTALGSAQQWFLNRQTTRDVKVLSHWNQALMFNINTEFSRSRLANIVKVLMFHHDILRTRFIFSESGEWSQYIEGHAALEDDKIPVEYIDLAARGRTSYNEEDLLHVQQSLNVVDGPVIRFVAFKLGEQRHVVVVAANHLVIDGISWRIISEDFETVFNSVGKPALPEKSHSFDFWTRRLADYALSSMVSFTLTKFRHKNPSNFL